VIGSEMAVPVRRPFDPVAFDLDANFRLTRFSDLKGLGCKVPRDGLNKMLEPLKEQEKSQLEAEQMHFQYVIPAPRIGQLYYCYQLTVFMVYIVYLYKADVRLPIFIASISLTCHKEIGQFMCRTRSLRGYWANRRGHGRLSVCCDCDLKMK